MVTEADSPFPAHYLDLDGLRLQYVDEGAGDPVVMVHGNPTWSFYYRGLVRALRPDYRTIVPDHIGCGLSDKPDDARYPYTLDRRARDLETLLGRLGVVGGITLVVHDWGGMIGLLYAARNPGRVRRLVILNTAGFHLPPGARMPGSLALIRDTPLGPFLVRGLNAFCLGAAARCTVKPLAAEARRGLLAPYDSWANRVAVLRFVQTIPLRPTDDGYELVSEVGRSLDALRDVPTLIAWGMRDFVFTPAYLDEWARRLPNAEVHRFDRAGHYVLEDAGAEVEGLVGSFLARHPLGVSAR